MRNATSGVVLEGDMLKNIYYMKFTMSNVLELIVFFD